MPKSGESTSTRAFARIVHPHIHLDLPEQQRRRPHLREAHPHLSFSLMIIVSAAVIAAGVGTGGTSGGSAFAAQLSTCTDSSVASVAPFAAGTSLDAYLDGNRVLRGVNSFDLMARRNSTTACLNNPQASYDFLSSRGTAIVRLPIAWENLQPLAADGDLQATLNAPVNAAYLATVQVEVQRIAQAGMRTILDLHSGGQYPSQYAVAGTPIVAFGSGISVAQASNVWLALSETFKNDSSVAAYDLFNETKLAVVPIDTYKSYTQSVVDSLRANGDAHAVWVESMKEMTTGVVAVIAPEGPWITDNLNAVVYSQHFYPGGTGTTNSAYSTTKNYSSFLSGLTKFGNWCRTFAVHCSVGEVGWPSLESGSTPIGANDDWSALGEQFYTIADGFDLDVTYFATSSKTDPGWLMAYSGDGTAISTSRSQSAIIEGHPTV